MSTQVTLNGIQPAYRIARFVYSAWVMAMLVASPAWSKPQAPCTALVRAAVVQTTGVLTPVVRTKFTMVPVDDEGNPAIPPAVHVSVDLQSGTDPIDAGDAEGSLVFHKRQSEILDAELFSSNRFPRFITDLAGKATVSAKPGHYRVFGHYSVGATRFLWRTDVTLKAGQNTVELSNDTASVDP